MKKLKITKVNIQKITKIKLSIPVFQLFDHSKPLNEFELQ